MIPCEDDVESGVSHGPRYQKESCVHVVGDRTTGSPGPTATPAPARVERTLGAQTETPAIFAVVVRSVDVNIAWYDNDVAEHLYEQFRRQGAQLAETYRVVRVMAAR
jgi:hypothetical protein